MFEYLPQQKHPVYAGFNKRTPALTENTVLSRTETGLRSDGAIADSAPTIRAEFIAEYAQQQRVHGFQRIPARRSTYPRYPATAL